METDVHFRRDSNADHNRSEHQNKKKHNKSNTNNHINCNKSSKTKDKTFDGQEFNASKDKHQNKNKTQTQREKDNKHKKSSNSVKNNNNFDNDLTINTTNKCNNNKKNKDKDKDHSKDNSSTTSNHKINKNKDNHLKTNKDVINNNKSLNDLLDNNKSLSNRETSLDTNQKNSCLVVKEFKFFKEKAKKKNISEQKAATSKSSKVSTGANSSNSCGTTLCKQVLKSCDVLSISGVSDGSAKHKSKGIGHKETKQCGDGSVSCHSSSLGSCATSSANITCDSKTNKLKTSSKTNKSTTNAKYSHSSDNCSETKKNLSPNKTITQSSKASKNKSLVVESNDNKCPKNDGKRKNKVNLIKDNPLYDEDIIDGFAILSFKSFDDIELTINGRSGQKKKKEKPKKEESTISSTISSIISSVSSCSSTSVSSQLKCYNKSNENKSSKLSANKHLKNGSKDIKNSNNKSETKNRVDSKVGKCSKKAKQSENNGNNNNNNNNKNKNVDNNKEQQKPNNVVNSVNSSKNQSLESSTVLTVNKKTSINEHKPEVSINKRESRTEEDLKEVQSNAILDKSVSEDTKSISLTTSTSLFNSSQHKSPTISLNSSNNSSISDCDKSLTSKSRSSVSNDSSLSSPSASSTTLPLISSDGESDGQLSDCHTIRVNVKNDCESNSSNTCSLSKAPINTNKSNNLLTPPPLPVISSLLSDSSSSQVSGQSVPQQLCGSDVSKHFGLNHKSSDISEPKVSEPKDKSVNGYERTFQSHFIESVLRNNTPPEDSNVRNIEDTSVISIKHCPPSSPLINKYENNNKENNLNSLSKVCVKNQKTSPSSTSPSNFSDNNSHNYSTNSSNCVKTAINETIPQSHGLGVKRPSSPVPSNQSTASKQIRYSSPNNQTNCFDSHNSVPQQSASTSNRSTSNSLSNLSQLSQSIGQNLSSSKERDKEREESTKSSTSRSTPLTTNTSPENTFTPNFSTPKSQLWSTSSSTSNGSVVSTVPHLSSPSLAPRPTTPSIGLSSSLHNNHLSMFASPIPPVSLPSVGGAVAPSATPSPFIGDSLFSHQNQDFLRRELDTRFLASQDRTINIPPPPYMRPELHPHMHLTQSQPFPLNASIGNPLMPASNPQLYEKYPKMDQPFYGRNALGLPGFPSLSPLLTPSSSSTAPQSSGLTTSSNTPFGSPGHSAAFQPKLNSLSTKNKPSAKSGRWCAMHVRIAWEIYHHQQKQHLDLTHKSGVTPGGSAQNKGGTDMLRPLNHLFSLGSRPQELPPFSSALLSAAASRAPFESPLPSHHNQFVSAPASPHLSTQTTNFPRFPTFGGFGSLNSSLSLPPVAGPPTPSVTLFGPTPISGTRDLPIPGCLPGLSASGPDLWSRSASTRSTSALFPPLTASTSSTSSSSSSSWGGLKAEAERNRINEELYNKRKASESVEKEAKRFERDKSRSDDRLEAKHRDQSHNSLKHNSSISSHLRNGDIYSDNKTKDWIRNSHKRDTSRSPVHQSHHSHSHSRDHSSHHSHHSHSHSHHTHSHIHSQSSIKSGNPDMSAFDNNKLSSVGVKDELKDDLHSMSERERMSRFSSDISEQKVKTSAIPTATSNASNLLSSSSSLAAIGLNNQLEKARIMGLFGLQGTPPPISPHFNANNSSDPLRSYWNPLMASVDPFKNLHDFQVRPDFLDRDNIFQRYSLLNSSGGGASLMERLAKESAEKEMLSHSIEKHNSKLMASHLRSNESFTSGLPIHPPHTPHTPHMPPSQLSTPSSLSSNIFPANPYLNSLHSLSASAGSYVKNNKVSSALHTSSSSTSSSEPSSPSLAPTNGTLPTLIPNVLNHSIHSSNLTNSKLSIGSLIDNPLEAIKDINNKTNETNSSSVVIPNGSNNKSVDVLETNSR